MNVRQGVSLIGIAAMVHFMFKTERGEEEEFSDLGRDTAPICYGRPGVSIC